MPTKKKYLNIKICLYKSDLNSLYLSSYYFLVKTKFFIFTNTKNNDAQEHHIRIVVVYLKHIGMKDYQY